MLFVFYLFLFLVAKPIQASETLFKDDFNTGDMGSWVVTRNSQHHHPQEPCFNKGYPAEWEIVEGKLGININGIPCTTEIVPQNLDLTEINNYEFEFDWYFPTSTHMDRNVLVKWQDKNNWYGIHILDNKLLLQKVIGGQLESLYNNWGYFQFEKDQSYSFKIGVIDDSIAVWIDGQLVFKTLDRPPFLSGYKTLGFQASSGNIFHSVSFFDNLIVSSLDQAGEKRLGVPLYKQHDPEWRDREYDHASEWAETNTIARWGCALTSATMILDHYGINQLPSGLKLNPAKLNLWLKNQPDGYIGEGLINWLAITRLTRTMSEALTTPTLEYQWIEGKIENALKEIAQNKPIVLQLPGHFLVADGYTAQQTDLFIKDPAHNRHLLSQHRADLLSVRSFIPSYTNLSYLLIAHDPEVKVTLIDESGSFPTELEIYPEYIQSFSDDAEGLTKIKMIQSLAKPLAGKYLLKIDGDEEKNNKVEVYTYDTEGEVAVLTREILGTKLYYLTFNPTGESQLNEIVNKFTLLRDLLKTLYSSGEITTKYAYLKLDLLATYAEDNEVNQARYQNLIIKTAQELKEFVPYLTVIRSLAPSN